MENYILLFGFIALLVFVLGLCEVIINWYVRYKQYSYHKKINDRVLQCERLNKLK